MRKALALQFKVWGDDASFAFHSRTRELLSLEPAFKGCTADQFIDRVIIKNQRPKVDKTWPPLSRLVLPEAWDKDPRARPDMKRVAIMIRGDLNDLTTDDQVLHRTQHMEERSTHSMDFTFDKGPRTA